MELLNSNGVKVYNLSAGKLFPNFISETQKKKLSKDDGKRRSYKLEFRKRVELIQDFKMKSSCQRVRMTPDEKYIIATGVYPPMIKTYETNQLSMKFDRYVSSEVVQLQILSSDYSKLAMLESDRNIEFHTASGFHYKTRIPKTGRDMAYHQENCELYIVGSSADIYRFNLIQGQFYESLHTGSNANNCINISPAHQLLGIGSESGILECWDPRSKSTASHLQVTKDQITALEFNKDGLGLSIGTSKGLLLYYDIRMEIPIWSQQYQYEIPITSIKFEKDYLFCSDRKVMKIWDYKKDEHITTIETPGSINEICLVPNSGLCFIACEHERIQSFFIPSIGTAPKWCGFLENITEELEEESSLYTDYKFITKNDLENLSLTNLVGTKYLKAYMHGYFMDYKLYNKMVTISDPDAYERWKKEEVKRKMEEKKEKKIIIKRNLPKVNKELAERIMSEENEKVNVKSVIKSRKK